MRKFQVQILRQIQTPGYVEIEAENEKNAREIAYRGLQDFGFLTDIKWDNDDVFQYDDEVGDIEEIEGEN
jgi:hypothetical protein